MKNYYDPEYDRIVTEDVIENQYSWFSKQKWFTKDYETFKRENFTEIEYAELIRRNTIDEILKWIESQNETIGRINYKASNEMIVKYLQEIKEV